MAQDGREILDLIHDIAIVVEDGRILHMNTAGLEFAGEAALGQAIGDRLPMAALEALEGNDPEPGLCRHLDGTNRSVHWRVSRLGDNQLLLGRDVTGQVDATDALALRMSRLEALHGITLAVARGESIGAICDIAFRSLAPVVSIVRGGVAALEGNELRVFYHWNRGHSVLGDKRKVRVDETPSNSCITRRMPIQMRTTGSAALRWRQFRSLQRAGVRAVLYTPLIGGDEVLGLISLGTANLGGFTPEDIEAVSEVAAQLSAAMDRHNLVARIEGNAEELERRVEERTAELERTSAQLVHAAKLSTLGELSAGLAHELSQPISVVSGYIELLQDGELSEERQARALEIMSAAIQRMGMLSKKLTNYAKAQPEAIQPFDLRVAVDMAVELSASVAKQVEVRWERPPFAVEALGDVHRIEQVLINLLANAQQATEDNDGEAVDVAVGITDDGRAWVVVQDDGAGVPLDIRDRIFDPFFTTRKEGTGLGLAISARIIQEHGGSLAHERSERGARFRLVLNQP